MFVTILATVTALTAVRDSYPSVSRDGERLLFHSNRSGRQAIWIAQADGSEPRMLFDGAAEGRDPGTAVWSPDGRTILFAMRPAGSADENGSEIYTVAADGKDLRRLTKSPGDDSHPHWSADGTRIFFNSARATPDLKADWGRQWIDIYSMAADGSDVRRHTDCRSICTYPVPSPDGRSVVHRRIVGTPGRNWDQSATSRNSEVVVTELSGGGTRNLSNHPAYDGWPAWSPDGEWIVFASNRDGQANVGQIYRVRPDGSEVGRLSEPPFSHAQPSFGANGRSLYVYRLVEREGTEMGQIARIDLEPAK